MVAKPDGQAGDLIMKNTVSKVNEVTKIAIDHRDPYRNPNIIQKTSTTKKMNISQVKSSTAFCETGMTPTTLESSYRFSTLKVSPFKVESIKIPNYLRKTM